MADSTKITSDSSLGLTPATFRRYTVALHRYLLRRLRGRREETADLTQEIFERLLRKRDRPEAIRNPLAYLYGIASHVVAETLEQEPGALVSYDSELTDRIAESRTPWQPQDPARDVGLRKDIAQALAKLPRAHLNALLLVEGEGLSCKEAARKMGYTPGTIKVYLAQARATLKKLLADYEGRKA